MRRIPATALTVLAPVLFGFEWAAAKDPQVDCNNQVTQLDMNVCAHEGFKQADAELNAVWEKARVQARQLDATEEDPVRKDAAKSLLEGQRGWIAYRDGQCKLEGWSAHGGSMEPMLISGCMEELTRERIKQLTAFISGEDP